MTSTGRPTLIINIRAGRGEHHFRLAQEALVRKGLQLEAAHPVSDPAMLSQALAEAIGGGASS